jgi:hypothetical protein
MERNLDAKRVVVVLFSLFPSFVVDHDSELFPFHSYSFDKYKPTEMYNIGLY